MGSILYSGQEHYSSFNDLILIVKVDDDLKDDDIREAFKIFDNVSNHFLSLISGVNSFWLGRQWNNIQNWIETRVDEPGGRDDWGGVWDNI